MTGDDTQPGQPFDGRYRVLGRLGVGGMATVYLAEDSSLGRKVALKVMAERYAEDGEFVERFRREAQAAARLNHPNIIAVYDRGEADGRPYIAMEYLQGRTLKQVIQKEGPLPPERAIAIAMQVLAGLRYAHEHGVVHRDVKPHNVLVGDDGRIKVTDFGIAHAGDPQMTEVGSIVGTAQYLSPEQARGRSVGPQTDVYSLGVVLYEMLAGRVPFEGDSSVAIAMQHVSDEAPPLRSLVPQVPESLGMVVAHSMLKQPEQRYGSADEFSADLDRVRRGLVPAAATALIEMPREPTQQVPAVEATRVAPPAAPPPSLLSGEKLPPRPTPRRRSRWPWLLVLLLVLAVGALAAFALGVGSGDGKSQTTATQGTTTTQQTTAVASHVLEDLTGKSYREAASALLGYGLTPKLDIKRQRVRDAQNEADVVVATVPPAGTQLHGGDTVLLKVSRGQKEIPNIVGVTLADALAQLGSDFKPVQKSEASDTVDKGKITRTEPPVGERIPVGSTVTIWVSTGPASVQVPSLIGKTEDEARATLGSAGLIVKEPPGSRCSDDVEVGRVAKQSPQVGKLVRRNTAVSFDLANSPCTVDVPNVRTLPVDQAIQLLQAKTVATRNIKIQYQTVTEPSQDGIVLDQDIEGTNTKPFQVTLTVGKLDAAATPPATTP
jgi:serine/threonine-protein kinase